MPGFELRKTPKSMSLAGSMHISDALCKECKHAFTRLQVVSISAKNKKVNLIGKIVQSFPRVKCSPCHVRARISFSLVCLSQKFGTINNLFYYGI